MTTASISTTIYNELPIDRGVEQGFSSLKYLVVALAIATLAGIIFTVSIPAAIVLSAVAVRYLWSAAVIQLNEVAEGSCLEKPIHFLYAVAMEVNSLIIAMIVLPLTFFSAFHAPQGNLDGRPILMLNGYLSFGSTWYYLREKLVEAGYGPVYTMNVGSFRSIETYAEQIQEKVQEIQAETGRKDLDLITHSKGGLVGSYFAVNLAKETNATVTNLVTIGWPLAGTSVAYLGLGYDAQEMWPDSDFNRELREKIERVFQDSLFSHRLRNG